MEITLFLVQLNYENRNRIQSQCSLDEKQNTDNADFQNLM
jgi:hypothetical protein